MTDKEKIRLLRLDIAEFNREKIRDLKDDIEDFDIEIFRTKKLIECVKRVLFLDRLKLITIMVKNPPARCPMCFCQIQKREIWCSNKKKKPLKEKKPSQVCGNCHWVLNENAGH